MINTYINTSYILYHILTGRQPGLVVKTDSTHACSLVSSPGAGGSQVWWAPTTRQERRLNGSISPGSLYTIVNYRNVKDPL